MSQQQQQPQQRGDIEIPLDVMRELSVEATVAYPIKVSYVPAQIKEDPPQLSKSVSPEYRPMAATRLPSLSQHSESFSPISQPNYGGGSRLISTDNFKKYKDTRVPYSVLRGYVYGQGQLPHKVPSVIMPGGPTTNKMPNRGRRQDKNKEPDRRSRSECTLRDDAPKGRQLLRMLADNAGDTGTLPRIPQELCLVHNPGAVCTCGRGQKSLSVDRAQKGSSQLRDRLCMAASRLGSHDILNTERLNQVERERIRSEISQGLTRRASSKAATNEKVPESKRKGKYSLVKSYPPKQKASSRNYINTWLEAGASVPKFTQPKPVDG